MTLTNSIRRTRTPRPDVPIHRFAVGQTVRLKGGFGRKPGDIFRITATLPAGGGSLQYRIRNDEERHERVTAEDDVELFGSTQPARATLIERTFGHGQGTKTQQSRDQEAEAGKGHVQA